MRVQMLCLALSGALLAACATTPADPALYARIDRVEARVEAAEAIRAVKRVQHSYGHYLNDGLWDDLALLLAEDAVAEFGAVTVTGREAIRRHFMDEAGRTELGLAPGQLNAHLQLQPIVTLDADGLSAKGTWHEIAMLGRYGESASWVGGVYENEYRVELGAWQISRIRFFEQYRGAYEDYGHTAPAAWNIPYHFDAAHVGVTIPEGALEPGEATRWTLDGPSVEAARLHDRVQALNEETAVSNLQHAFGYYLDRKMYDDVADLFTDEGALEIAGLGAYVGRAHIRSALEALFGPTPLQTGELFDHTLLQTVVTLDNNGGRAAARSSQLAQLGRNGEWAGWELGVYENTFVKEDGAWKIEAVRYFPRMTTDYDEGWAVNAQPSPNGDDTLPADRAPQDRYASYPDVQYVAFHSGNAAYGTRAVRYPDGPLARVPEIDLSWRRDPTIPLGTDDLDAVDSQLSAAIGVDAVENLMSSYGYYIDESDWNGMADTYSVDRGSKELTGVGVYVGRERIRTALNMRGPQGGRTASFFTIHQLTQPVIHISEDGQSANARLRLFQSGGNADGSSGSWISGVYENTAVFEDGEWKFGRQDLTHILNASYRNGWARVGAAFREAAAANPNATGRDALGGGITQGLGGALGGRSWSEDFPPDHAIRARQYSFPDITTVAFHYRNPVSGREPPELLP